METPNPFSIFTHGAVLPAQETVEREMAAKALWKPSNQRERDALIESHKDCIQYLTQKAKELRANGHRTAAAEHDTLRAARRRSLNRLIAP